MEEIGCKCCVRDRFNIYSSVNDDDDVIMSPVLKNINKITFMNAFFFTLPEKFFVQFEIATIGFFL